MMPPPPPILKYFFSTQSGPLLDCKGELGVGPVAVLVQGVMNLHRKVDKEKERGETERQRKRGEFQ